MSSRPSPASLRARNAPRDEYGRFLPTSARRGQPNRNIQKPKPTARTVGSKFRQENGRIFYRYDNGGQHKEVEIILSPKSANIRASPKTKKELASPSRSVGTCKTWFGCVYTSIAEDARLYNKKLRGGIIKLHDLLHIIKHNYPAVYEQLREGKNDAWKYNRNLAKIVRSFYINRVGSE